MARNVQIGENVYVPCSKVQELGSYPYSLYHNTVINTNNRSLTITTPEGNDFNIGSALVHRTVGVYIFNIGDFETETSLLNPLSKSILQFCRLIHEDDSNTVLQRIRSIDEFETLWRKDINAFKYVILIGHGSSEGLKFGVEGWVNSTRLTEIMNKQDTSEKVIISLACQTGYQQFSSPISKLKYCSGIIAPFHSIHGSIASQFCQTFLANHLHEGFQIRTAFKKSRESVAGSSSFKLWQNGRLV